MGERVEPIRQHLIDLCERAVVPESKWSDRDSAESIRKIGEAWALLRAGCEYRVLWGEGTSLKSDAQTWWIEISSHGFASFDWDPKRLDRDTYYIPTAMRLDGANGEDWY